MTWFLIGPGITSGKYCRATRAGEATSRLESVTADDKGLRAGSRAMGGEIVVKYLTRCKLGTFRLKGGSCG